MQQKLVVIDMQEIFRAPDSEWAVGGYPDAARRIQQLAPAFQGHVIWTQFIRDPDEAGSWHDYYQRWAGCRLAPDAAPWQITLDRQASDPVLALPTFSKWGAGLARLTRDCDALVVCGVATDCCVLSTVLGAADAGKSVTVVSDACAGITPEAHQQALSLMALLSPMVTLRTTAEVLSAAQPSATPAGRRSA